MTPFRFEPIGVLRTVFTEKVGVPRQSLMVPEAKGVLSLPQRPEYQLALRHLETFSHVWLIYVFDRHVEQEWRPLIAPPRESAPEQVGVFASRSPHRPNPLGLSLVKLDHVDFGKPDGIHVHISGVDILDQSPVLDIKPYLPYADSVPQARSGWAEGAIPKYTVNFDEIAQDHLTKIEARHEGYTQLLTQVLEWDPRPTAQRKQWPIGDTQSQGRSFVFRLAGWDVRWRIQNRQIFVTELIELE